MSKEENRDKNKTLRLDLINSSVPIDFMFLGLFCMIGKPLGLFDKINFFTISVLGFLLFLVGYHFSWRTLIINEEGVEIHSVFPFMKPISVPYWEIEKTKITAYTLVIDFRNLRNKLKLNLIYPLWAEFLTINVSSDKIDRALEIIENNKKKKMDESVSSFLPSTLKNDNNNKG